jgi:Zn-dependent peptidase ImmA (M78 family)
MINNSLEYIKQKFSKVDFSDIENQYPVPIGAICDKIGIEADLDSNFSDSINGVIEEKNEKYVMILNNNKNSSCNRFTIARLIYVYLNKTEKTQERHFAQDKILSIDNMLNIGVREETTKFNEFAAELIMPKEIFIIKFISFSKPKFLQRKSSIDRICHFFGVSKNAAYCRAVNLGLEFVS